MPELEAFFHDLRALRASAGLSLAELARRAHFPAETLAAAESGPAVPPNPVLVAYVQACGGPVGPWEDRWRAVRAAAGGDLAASIPAATEVLESATAPGPAAPGPAAPGPAAPGAAAPWPAAPPPPPRRHRLRALMALAAAAAALGAAGTAVAVDGPAAHPSAAARPRTSPSAARPGASLPAASQPGASRPSGSQSSGSQSSASRPRPQARPPAAPAPAPPAAPVMRVAGVGCPASPGGGVALNTARPGPPWTAAQGGWTGDGCDGASVWTMNPAGKQPAPSVLTWSFGAPAGAAQCTLSVYVPTQNALGQAGYTVTADSGGSLGTVTVDQAASAGHWVTLGTFAAVSGYQIQLAPVTTELTAAGPAAKGPGKSAAKPAPAGHNSAIAASAAAATCSGSPG